MPKGGKLGALYEYVRRAPSANYFTIYPGDPTEVIVYRILDGPGGAERGKVPMVQGSLDEVLVYMREAI